MLLLVLRQFIDKAIKFHPRERLSNAKEMLQVFEDELISIAPTVAQFPATSVSTDVQPPTVISAPLLLIQTHPPIIPVNGGMRDWQKATIIGGVIGLCVFGGMTMLNK